MSSRQVTILISGGGSNLQSLIDARDAGRLNVDINHVISNQENAFGLQRARQAGIVCSVLKHSEFTCREDFDRALLQLLNQGNPDLVVLAGFMRILGAELIDQFDGSMINLHPSLLPLYRGTNTYQRAIDAGDEEHGASIHFVTSELDAGPVISQVRIPLMADDDADSLAARLFPREHELMVASVELFCTHKVQCTSGLISVNGEILNSPYILGPDGHF